MATAELLPTRVGVSAEQEDEVFEIFDEAGNLVGREARGVVHTQGLLHRAVYCFLFDTAGRLLIQRRSDAKKVGPGQWDLSCAEHLQPGESFRDAAARGLEEELGVRGVELTGPLNEVHLRRLVIPDKIYDYEFVTSFRGDGYDGPLDVNAAEVSAVEWRPLEQLAADMAAAPEQYTEWFRGELLGPSGGGGGGLLAAFRAQAAEAAAAAAAPTDAVL